jgi:hypothetical protein
MDPLGVVDRVGGPYGPALGIAFGIVVGMIVLGAIVLLVRRRLERRALAREGRSKQGKWWRGPNAPDDDPLVYQHREDSGQGAI